MPLADQSRMGTTRTFFVSALAFVTTVSSACKTGANSSAGAGSQALIQQGQVQQRRHPAPAPRLTCPPLGSTLVAAPQSKDGHRVILNWKASRRADAKHANAVGYCIYRGPKPNAPPTELINHLPFPETQCVDDSVENGKQYYYVVRAVSARGVTSDVSKPPAPARIPATPPTRFQAPEASIPLCRESPEVAGP
jgi:hypothetical protein